MVPKQLTHVVGGFLDRLIPFFVPVVQRLEPRVLPFLERHQGCSSRQTFPTVFR